MNEHEQMLTSILNCSRTDLYVDPQPLNEDQQKQLKLMQNRLAQGEPLQYILGHCNFMGISLNVDERVLIPRPETELLVEHVTSLVKQRLSGSTVRILDIGTGSGNIAIALAKFIKNSFVKTLDVSAEAQQLAQKNARMNNVAEQIKFVVEDVCSFLKNHKVNNEQFDLIVSNPPYIRTQDLTCLPQDVQKEPRLALEGGEDGLKFYKDIIEYARNFLKPNGVIAFEIGDGQKSAIEELFQRHLYYKDIRFIQDYTNTDRIVEATLNG